MKIALLSLLGLALGALGGAALGIGAGLAWIEIFKTTDLEGYSGMLVFFTFMPLGAAIGGLGGALLFGVIAIRDAEIAIEREPVRSATVNEVVRCWSNSRRPAFVQCKNDNCVLTKALYFRRNSEVQQPATASMLTPRGPLLFCNPDFRNHDK